jgi:hypothetical protein
MPYLKIRRLFISHAWDYNGQYHNLVNLLQNKALFTFYNHSVPKHDPLDAKTIRQLEERLRNQMSGCHVVLVIAAVYPSYRKWIQKELEIAAEYGKPIIGVKPSGQQLISLTVQSFADEIVGWNSDSIVKAIRRAC